MGRKNYLSPAATRAPLCCVPQRCMRLSRRRTLAPAAAVRGRCRAPAAPARWDRLEGALRYVLLYSSLSGVTHLNIGSGNACLEP